MISFKDISIVIPVGPKEDALEKLLADLRPVKKDAEIITVKGSQRARQLNEGARKATREFLWFLHADSRLSSKTLGALLKSLNNDSHALHYFNLRFLPDGPPLMRINEIGCWIRSRILGIPFGDQGFVLSKENFERIGGCPENVPYGEDHLFIWRARQKGIRLRCTGASLYTSARRYAETGWTKLTWDYARRWTHQAWPEWKKTWVAPPSLIVFAKYPEPGNVKSRLAKDIGPERAATLYKRMVEEVIDRTRPANGNYRQIICFDPSEKVNQFTSWFPGWQMLPQPTGDLGQRMFAALEAVLKKSRFALLIGTDCLEIDRALIENAFERLRSCDVVLGPAKDGGYYLIGCKKIYPDLFSHIDWSTEHVLSQTLRAANALKLSVSLLPELEDIDTAEQYGRSREKIRPDFAVL